jgi:hypothetical protein
MSRRKNQRRPELEALESVELLSGVATSGHHELARLVASESRASVAVVLSGVEKGTYRVRGGGTTAIFSGKGKVSPLGGTTVSGTLELAAASTTGQLTIAGGRRGKIFASVNQVAPSTEYIYEITGGTKSFAGAAGTGIVTTTLVGSASRGRFALDFLGGSIG